MRVRPGSLVWSFPGGWGTALLARARSSQPSHANVLCTLVRVIWFSHAIQQRDSPNVNPQLSAIVACPDAAADPNEKDAVIACAAEIVAVSAPDSADVAHSDVSLRFEPPIDRPAPPIFSCLDVEGIWISPTETTHQLLWDPSMCVDNSQGAEVRSLMKKACKVHHL